MAGLAGGMEAHMDWIDDVAADIKEADLQVCFMPPAARLRFADGSLEHCSVLAWNPANTVARLCYI